MARLSATLVVVLALLVPSSAAALSLGADVKLAPTPPITTAPSTMLTTTSALALRQPDLAVAPAPTAPTVEPVAPPSVDAPSAPLVPAEPAPTAPLPIETSFQPAPISPLAAQKSADVAAASGEVAAPEATTREFVVGYRGSFPEALVEYLGGRVLEADETLGFAVVEMRSASTLRLLAGVHPNVRYVEDNLRARWDAAQWDATQWDAAQWDAAQWDAAQWDAEAGSTTTWDAAQWDAAQWDAAQWDAAQWDAAQWDAAQWDAAQWDAAQWDAAQWDAAQWDGTPTVDPGFGNAWQLGALHAPDAWRTTMGYHARTICVIDSGIDASHPDLARNVKRLADGSFGYDFVNRDNDPSDDGGHGTHVAGIAAAVTGNGEGVAGVSQAWLLAAKVLGADGSGRESDVAMAIRWCADNGANIGLMALHIDQAASAVADAVKYAKSKGVLLVAASGNSGGRCEACVAYPAAYPDVLAVGASAPDSSVAPFSNGGKQLDLVAPGVQIPGPLPGGRYGVASGTSQAAAAAAGGAALVWAAKPALRAADLAKLLTSTADDDGRAGDDWSYGRGHLRLDLALASGS